MTMLLGLKRVLIFLNKLFSMMYYRYLFVFNEVYVFYQKKKKSPSLIEFWNWNSQERRWSSPRRYLPLLEMVALPSKQQPLPLLAKTYPRTHHHSLLPSLANSSQVLHFFFSLRGCATQLGPMCVRISFCVCVCVFDRLDTFGTKCMCIQFNIWLLMILKL